MPGFQFRLASLLKVRQAERDQFRLLLADALARERVLHARRAELERERHAQLGQAREVAGPGRLDVVALSSLQRYALGLRVRLSALAKEVNIVAEEIDRRREVVVEADREVRVLEKLRERQHEQSRATQRRAESKQLDEVAAQASFAERTV